jgi:hypothetical protein
MWIIFTYLEQGIRTPTKIFKNSRLKTAYGNNNLRAHCKACRQLYKYSNCGVFKLKYIRYDQVYIGQTGRDLNTRDKEHKHSEERK